MLETRGGGGGGSGGGGDLERGAGALRRFQTRVNDLIQGLEGSYAGQTRLGDQAVFSRSSLSGSNAGFSEADGLFGQYKRVHASLVSLSRMVGDQIELLSIAVHAAEVGFDNVDEDLRRRFAEIQARVDQAQAAQEEGWKNTGPAPERTDDVDSGGY